MGQRGYIALDIDGTVTDRTHTIPKPVKEYLNGLQQKGWNLLFITGRIFAHAHKVLGEFDFPFYFAVQNGADVLYMPEREVVNRRYMTPRAIPLLEKIREDFGIDYIIYAGYEKGDFCYYRKANFSPDFLTYFDQLELRASHSWVPVSSFDGIEDFPMVKFFGTHDEMLKMNHTLSFYSELHATMIRDPMRPDLYLNLITAREATKGAVIRRIAKGNFVIGAGDDLNDVSLLSASDVKIAMGTAPEQLKKMADIIAPSGDEMGIIDALERVIS